MKTKLQILLSTLLLLVFQNTNACSCFPADYIFCETLEEIDDLTIVSATSIEFINSFLMKVKVIEELNNGFQEDTLIVFGQDGINCGENLLQFQVGDSMVLALDKTAYFSLNPADTITLDTIYYLDGCKLHHLNYSNNTITGTITENINSLSYEEFKIQIEDCQEYLNVENQELDNFEIYPIPASDFVNFNSEKAFDKIEIYNSNGKLIKQQFVENENYYRLNINDLNKGIYLFKIFMDDKFITKTIPIL